MTFQPFAVQCVTCGSSLRVTDAALIGTIASCPNCQSMVQIETSAGPATDQPPAPPPQLAVGAADVDSQAITQDAVVSGEIEWSGAPATSSPSGFAGGDTAAPPVATGPDQSLLSPQVRRSKQIALVATLSLTGLLLAGIVFVWFVQRWQAAAVASPRDPSIPVAPTGLEASRGGDNEVPDGPSWSQPNAAEAPARAAVPGAGPAKIGPAQSDTAQNDTAPLDASPEDDAGVDAAMARSAAAELNAPPTGATPAELAEDLLPPSPTGSASALVDATAGRDRPPADVDANAEPDGGSLTDLPPELAKFTEFLLTDGSLDKPTLPPPPSIDEVELEAASNLEEIDAGTIVPRKLNLAGDLGLRLAVSSGGYPATDLLLLIGQLTTVPIEIDWISFDLAGPRVDNPITVPKGMQTARQLLDAIADSLGAQWRQEQTLLLLTPTEQRFAELVARVSDLSDFGQGQETAIATLMNLLEPGSNEQRLKLQIGQHRSDQQLAVLAIEALRQMRGLPPQIPPDRWNRWANLGQPVEWPVLTDGAPPQQSDTPISLAAFLRACSRPNDAVCVINWHDLNRWGIGPESLLFPHAKRDAAATLAAALRRWNIQVRRVDDRHWWVGSQATYDRIPVLVWTDPLAGRLDAGRQRIVSISEANPDDQIRMVYDEPSDRLLVRMPRYLARQLPKLVGQ